ncbi:DNA phosphorothioation-dependent restriction protein DptG [Staphylococcus petrasii]|nr:DNA phosphorothioation-dependent restriction protein DptG [Staphylococcus petrasii]
MKEVFAEFEKRGVFFDRYTKEEVVNFYEKMNILDKKSDSGEVKYVKPVL